MVGYGIIDQQTAKAQARTAVFNPVYAVFIIAAVSVYYWTAVSEKAGLSALLTLSAIWQCSAFSLLVVGALVVGTVKGISAKSLQLQAVALACRLSSTTWLLGYIPFDQTGNLLYQCFDILSLAMVLWLLQRVVKAQRESNEDADQDNFVVAPFVLGSLVAAGLFHANLDQKPL